MFDKVVMSFIIIHDTVTCQPYATGMTLEEWVSQVLPQLLLLSNTTRQYITDKLS